MNDNVNNMKGKMQNVKEMNRWHTNEAGIARKLDV